MSYRSFDLEFYLSVIPPTFSTSVPPNKFQTHNRMVELIVAQYFWICSDVFNVAVYKLLVFSAFS